LGSGARRDCPGVGVDSVRLQPIPWTITVLDLGGLGLGISHS